MAYSPERKAAVLKRLLPPSNMAIGQLSQEEGISEGTLYKWRAEARGEGQQNALASDERLAQTQAGVV